MSPHSPFAKGNVGSLGKARHECFVIGGYNVLVYAAGKGSEIGDYLTTHPLVNCISFTGGDTGALLEVELVDLFTTSVHAEILCEAVVD